MMRIAETELNPPGHCHGRRQTQSSQRPVPNLCQDSLQKTNGQNPNAQVASHQKLHKIIQSGTQQRTALLIHQRQGEDKSERVQSSQQLTGIGDASRGAQHLSHITEIRGRDCSQASQDRYGHQLFCSKIVFRRQGHVIKPSN